MKHCGLPLILVPALLYPAAPALEGSRGIGQGDAERAALHAAAEPSLGELRGGTIDDAAALSTSEIAALTRARAAAPTLAGQRAGDIHLTDRDLKIIGIVLLAVLVIAVIA